jgi:hypothetical protein
MIATKSSFYKNIVFSIILLDLLILPYVQFIIIPAGLVIMAIILPAIDFSIRKDSDLACIVIITSCAFISTLISIFSSYADVVAFDNIKYFLQLTSTFIYFFAFKWYGSQDWCDRNFIIVPLYIFCIWYLILIYSYIISPIEAIELITNIYGRTSVSWADFDFDLRFPYLFSDPNTGVYFCLMVLAFLYHLKPNLKHFLILLLIGSMATFASQSTGALVAYSATIICSYYALIRHHRSNRKLFLLTLLSVFAYIYISNLIIKSEDQNINTLIQLSWDRLTDVERSESGGGRIQHWKNLLTMYPLPIGRGHVLYDNGTIKFPHSDLFGTIYRYGFIATILLIVFLFIKRKRLSIFSISAIVPFVINALLEDQKLFGLYLVFLGFSLSSRVGLQLGVSEYKIQKK